MLQNKWDLFIYFIVFVKFIFIMSALVHVGIKFSSVDLKILDAVDDVAEYWKEKSEFIFKICMAILLLVSFHPLRTTQTVLTKETKLLLYLFGFIIILTSEWKKFFADISFFEDYFDKKKL